MKNKLVIGLAVSVLLNAFLAGFIFSGCKDAGPPPFHHGPDGGPPHERGSMVDHILKNSSDLSEQGQQSVKDIVSKHKEALDNDKIDSNRTIFDEISKVLTAQKFDKSKIVELHKKLGDSETKMKTEIANTMTEIAESLSDEDRIKFFKKMLPKKPDGNFGDGPPPPDQREH